MRFRLYDDGLEQGKPASANTRTSAERVLFDSKYPLDPNVAAPDVDQPSALFTITLPTAVGGRIWEIQFSARKDAIVDRTDALVPWLTLAAGLISSLLLFFALHSLTSSRRRAVEMAQVITKDLRESEASLGQAQRIAQLGNWSLDSETGEMSWSAEMNRIFGHAATSTAQRYETFLGNIHPKDRKVLEQALQRAVEAGQDCDIEHPIVTKSGTRRVHTIVRRAQQGPQMLLNRTIRGIHDRQLTGLRLTVVAGGTQP